MPTVVGGMWISRGFGSPAFRATAALPGREDAVNDMTDRARLSAAAADDDVQPAVWRAAHRLAPLAVDVLLQGETGAGKDVLARDIHRWSGRPGKFIPINCAAIPEQLAESELFGHEAGAFTGAVRAREGKLEAADKGTLYLDEIDSMPLESQAKLLRALQERGAERVGGSRFYRTDFRVVASTKVSLPALVQEGRFRQDLYFRLNVVRLNLPALRESPARMLALFEEFVAQACTRHQLPRPVMAAATRQQLLQHSWPGNVRELRNAAERHVLGFEPLDEEPESPTPAPPPSIALGLSDAEIPLSGSLRDRMRAFEREMIVGTLKQHQGSVAKASAELQIPPNTLYYRIKTLGIQFTPQ
jgi:DNA-binding NtrC family response regulator